MQILIILIIYDKAYVTIVHLLVYNINFNIPLIHGYGTS
jgi:hypothetical protein